jgi:hypothetical protein
VLLLYSSHRLVESAEVIFGGLLLVFTPTLLPGARKAVMAAAVDDTDAVREVADAYRALVTLVESPAPRSPRREAGPVVVPLAPQVAPLAGDGLDSAAERLRARILARGWRAEDLVGLPGGDDLSPAAGRSVTAGLGAMEMLATSPPDFWPVLSAHYYPWEISGWLPPDSEWKAPAAPAKPPAETEPQTTPEVDVVTPAATEESLEDGAPEVSSGPPDIGPDHPAVGVYGTLEQVRAARVIAWKLLGPDGQKPSFKKLAAQLKANYDLALPDLGAGHMNLIYTP